MKPKKRFKNIKKADAIKTGHPFTFIERHHVYILTPVKKETLIIDYVCLFKARATEEISGITCGEGYQDCFNFLLKKNRRSVIWSTNRKIRKVLLSTRPGDPFEHHKHPTIFKKPVKKNEIFDWIYHSQYTIYIPTKERINNIRKGHFWDSKEAMFRFYDTVHPVEHGYSFHLYAPAWLTPYSRNFVYAKDTESTPIDDITLAELGIKIKRSFQINANPKDIVKYLPSWKMKTGHLKHDYYLSAFDVTAAFGRDLHSIIMTFGFLIPEAKVWRKNVK